ncbi:UDP-N-acetylgalactosamine-undecaprenyl-phosphateN-acetylgalactosaminephosphotransferase [Acaryochloris thomasi RCC1774]|uniref:UDP-N-acetylgalactosamine-undecaprenyl-phosphateN-acetylgalactosaminephosphotransferase n=1 Tax=Acaryochloris thomasi RCC1774 TaxID=1764569 RepID=A0A2W1JVR0_9CYAN|nr:sugar transferase [Acaryochloris thomasi]PZD72831.1 UDP-N-acetylgalactosamine-undecaprenyl-phosphateN-acetylgalactosaminephosphotransferase [Acaryochloris thomasi RCC1774]
MKAKRGFDFVCASLGLLILTPLFVVIAIGIKLDDRGSILFRQIRVGQLGHEFEIYKFRTMITDAETLGQQITVGNDSRITGIGALLRKYKLDELPQLINVWKGEMSLVGPRPEVPKYVNLYTPEQRNVLSVPPGITDLASIQFRNENDLLAGASNAEKTYVEEIMPRKLELNQIYISQASLLFDLRLILETLRQIVLN